jgi:tol-pal system protein YbgF
MRHRERRHGCAGTSRAAALLLLGVLCSPCAAGDEPTAPPPSADGNNGAYPLIELINQNEELTSEVSRLRGQLEELLETMRQSQERQKKIAADLDSRVGSIEAERKTRTVDAQAKEKALADKVRELENALGVLRQALSEAGAAAEENPAQKAYGAAVKEYEAGDYAAAIRHLGAIVDLFPDAAVVPDALYWLGDARWRQRDYAAAIAAEEQLLSGHPQSRKAPEALLLIGKAHLALADVEAARRSWQTLVSSHPDSDAARKARELLQQLP